jgi:thiol:disulfide interchange protein
MILAVLAAGVQLGLSNENFGWGELYTLTWFKVAMAALVFAMALSFMGVWEIPIPGFAASSTASKLSAEEGPFGAFCMGIFTTLLATPCSGPLLGPVLGYTLSQPAAVTFLVFGSVGVGMGLPYLLIGLFPALVSRLPKPGPWMETLKHLLGFVLLATVVYLFSTINEDYFLATLSLLFGIWFACWSIGRVPIYAEFGEKLRGWAIGAAIAAMIGYGSFYFLTPSESVLPWQPYSPQALALARAQGKTVMVDFTADWCPTCKTNLMFSINRDEVKKVVESNDVVTLLADWSDKNATIKQAVEELNSRSIPLLAIYPSDPTKQVMVLRDIVTQSQVLEALAEAGPSLDPKTAAVTSDPLTPKQQKEASVGL